MMMLCRLVRNHHQPKNEKYVVIQIIICLILFSLQRRGNDTTRLPAVDEEVDNDNGINSQGRKTNVCFCFFFVIKFY